MAGVQVKQEHIEVANVNNRNRTKTKNIPGNSVIDLDSSDDERDSGVGVNHDKRRRVLNGEGQSNNKSNKRKKPSDDVPLPAGFLDPLPENDATLRHRKGNRVSPDRNCKQFWKAGDFEGCSGGNWDTSSGGMDHLRVHPRFLHSNATSHKWVLGAFAELLDNALDEVLNGATYCKIDMLTNKKNKNRMLLIEDDGGGMDPEKMRQCMSLGYSLKSKVSDTIGQYGNGFKTSTMRLGADVIVFSRCRGKDGKRSTQSIGLLSYTFLRTTGKEDIVVPMLDYERKDGEWKNMKRASASDWNINLEAIVQWSPFSSESGLLKQFDNMKEQGTRIIIYNLWEDEQGMLELDFDTDKHDIQIRGVNRNEKYIEMAKEYPNSRHFLTYRHSLRTYASILYLRIPPGFRMILRGIDVEHHNIINDMMFIKEVTYRPQPGEGVPKDSHMVAIVTMGFVKDAKHHIDVQGYNVYHKNRLIKPFWRLWNAAGSDGRGVIGVLEANFVEPAHDKQGFERTNVLQRLETRLVIMQKNYWNDYCHKIGYAPRRNKNDMDVREPSYDYSCETPSRNKSATSARKPPAQHSEKSFSNQPERTNLSAQRSEKSFSNNHERTKLPAKHPMPPVNGHNNIIKENIINKSHGVVGASSSESTTPLTENIQENIRQTTIPPKFTNPNSQKQKSPQTIEKMILRDRVGSDSDVGSRLNDSENDCTPNGKAKEAVTRVMQVSGVNGKAKEPQSRVMQVSDVNGNEPVPLNKKNPDLYLAMEENHELKERLKRRDKEIFGKLLLDLEREKNRCKQLEVQIEEEKQKYEVLQKERDSIDAMFTEERQRRNTEAETLRKKLKEAEVTNKNLVDKVTQLQLEKMKTLGHKWGQ